MYRVALTVVLLVSLAAPAQGGWDEGWDAYKRRDYATTTSEFMALAEQGDVRAQVTLQIMEVFDEGGPKDQDKLEQWRNAPNEQNRGKALEWFRDAAEQGDTKAWTLLASMYDDLVVRFYFGESAVPQDRAKSLEWYRKAAEQGEVTAQKALSFILLLQDKNTESDYWNRAAAEQGDRWAQKRLGSSYSRET